MKKRYFIYVACLVGLLSQIVLASLTDGLVMYYPFSGNANDESGNGNNGVVHGATLTTDRFGNPNSAYSFNGIDNYIDMGNQPTSIASNIKTITAWVQFNDLTTNQEIVSKSTLNQGVELLLFKGNLSLFAMGSGGTSANGCCSSIQLSSTSLNLNTNDWFFVVATHNGASSTMKVYLNGVLQSSSGTTPSTILNPGNLLIGSWNDAALPRYFNGKVDDVRIYNRALSDVEIQQLFASVNYTPVVCPADSNGSTQQGIDQCKADPASCGITVNGGTTVSSGGFTQSQLDSAVAAAKQSCQNDPTSCGINSGTTVSSSTHATYNPTSGELHIPFIDVPGAFNTAQTYDIYLLQKLGLFTFDLDLTRLKLR